MTRISVSRKLSEEKAADRPETIVVEETKATRISIESSGRLKAQYEPCPFVTAFICPTIEGCLFITISSRRTLCLILNQRGDVKERSNGHF